MPLTRGKGHSIEQMLDALSRVGLRLASGRTIDDLTIDWARAEIERGGFEMLLAAMGGELLDPQTLDFRGWISEDVWHFDSECIEGEGDYTRIVESCIRLSNGDLKLGKLRDHVDLDAGEAWIEWTVAGRPQRHDLRADGDWVDPRIFDKLDNELFAAGSQRRFFGAVLAQDALIVCCPEGRAAALSDLTGLTFGSLA